jgi:hypothetical protein
MVCADAEVMGEIITFERGKCLYIRRESRGLRCRSVVECVLSLHEPCSRSPTLREIKRRGSREA